MPNIYTLFRARVEQYAGENVFYERAGDVWRARTWREFGDEVEAFGCALLKFGLENGAAVCILAGNVAEWSIADVATISAGGVGVGLYPTSSGEQCAYIINHADAEFVLVDTRQQLAKIVGIAAQLPRVKVIIALDEAAAKDAPACPIPITGYREFVQTGRAHRDDFAATFHKRAANAKPEDTAIMVYTSGTTGQPKGACLSHAYILNSVESLRACIPLYDDDTTFSYLPFCHVAERISGLYNRLDAGAVCYFVDDLTKLYTYMLDVRPTVFASLPRFFEKIHARIYADLESKSDSEKSTFHRSLEAGRRLVGLEHAKHARTDEIRDELMREAAHARRTVNDYFGGRLRLATSGGAPLPGEIAEFFAAAGLPILQAYGLTENICVAFNRPDSYRFGTVGQAMPGCEIKLETDDEITVKSQMMFSGYYKQPYKTAETFRDGWLLTGDLGAMDADGFLRITGRKKELIVTSSGKNIAPASIENLLKEHHLISHALVYGDGKSYLVALLTLNQLETESFARNRHIAFENFAALTHHALVRELVDDIVRRTNERVSSTEAIKRYAILERDFSLEADEVTPTMKLKRNVVSIRFADVIEALYAGR
ncbi:MAG: long-chain fatty acid--CoA ligase [Pyrinomonadaceae bacterium MAG19_C2-C3]|nr:long-chain fatty acid--CoA ligase [Pyrinomonadaceae bacterium MAG19_C2-C3]